MAHKFVYRIVGGVPAGATAAVVLSAGSDGIYQAEAWDFSSSATQRAIPIPGMTVPIGPVNPPSVVYIQGEYAAALNGDSHWLQVIFTVPGQPPVKSSRVPLEGAVGDTIIVSVYVYPVAEGGGAA